MRTKAAKNAVVSSFDIKNVLKHRIPADLCQQRYVTILFDIETRTYVGR